MLWLYGSRANGSYRDGSDYDLAIAFNDFSLSATDRALRPELLALEWQEKIGMPDHSISLVDINRAPTYLCEAILNAENVLFVKDDLRLVKEISRVWSMFEYLEFEQQRAEEKGYYG